MKNFNNDLVVHRGETFSIDKTVQNQNGSPYIISSEINNPFWLITISTTRYQQKDRYILSKWLDLSTFPRFNFTNAIDLMSLKLNSTGDTPMYPDGFEDENIQSLISVSGHDNVCAYGYINGELKFFQPGDAIFFVEDENGIKTYKYWKLPLISNGWTKYECRIISPFTHDITQKWMEQSYTYSINLEGGILMRDYLEELCTLHDIPFIEQMTNKDLYNLLVEKGAEFVEGFTINRPLGIIDTDKPILTPHKLSVLSDLQGGR